MNNHLIPFDIDNFNLMNSRGDLPLPYSQEIFLMDCHIAGTSYIDEIKELYQDLKSDQKVILKREAKNEYDDLAILVLNEEKKKLGYIPRKNNEVISRLMDAGKLIYATIISKRLENEWYKIDIKVFMKDL